MSWTERRSVRIAILDLYEGVPNQGMRCIREIIKEWGESYNTEIESKEFDVRLKNELPDTSWDIYISTGGPGDPLVSRFEDCDIAWCRWLNEMERWNNNPDTVQKKFVFFICHSFQLASRYFNAGRYANASQQPSACFPSICLKVEKKSLFLKDSVILFMEWIAGITR